MNPQPPRDAPRTRRRGPRYAHATLLWLVAVAPLAGWGLPGRETDPLLFGGEPWSGQRLSAGSAAQQRQARGSGADTDLNPLGGRDRIIDLTASHEQRAEILTRYRLFSRQPDEMITFMALQRMRPSQGDFDPRLYQYGGAYIYLIGASLGAAALCGLATLSSDVNVYLEQPELFARFYVVARVVTLLFAAGLLLSTARLAQLAGGRTAGWAAWCLAATAPVVLCGALEAKPHLPSVCMQVWAALAALRYCDTGRMRDALRMGLFSGAAAGLVLNGAAAWLLWPAVWLVRRRAGGAAARPLLASGLASLCVYALTNPYVLYNAVANRAALSSNLGNSTAMYRVGEFDAGAARVGSLLVESVGAGVPLLAVIAAALLARRFGGRLLVAALPGIGIALLAVSIGAGKPAEFARFLLLPAVLACVGAGASLGRLAVRSRWLAGVAFVAAVGLQSGYSYVRAFAADAGGLDESRRLAAQWMERALGPGDAIALTQEPAPYSVPPVNFTHRRAVLLPPSPPADFEPCELPPWLVLTADGEPLDARAWWRRHYRLEKRFPREPQRLTPITWANKAVFVYRRVPCPP